LVGSWLSAATPESTASLNQDQTAPPSSVAGAAEGETTLRTTPPGNRKVIAFFEVRPSYTHLIGEFHTEDTLELGYQPNAERKFTYVQYFNTNMYNPATKGNWGSGLGFSMQDGYLRSKLNNLWVSNNKKTNFGIQTRTYLPTLAVSGPLPSNYDRGMVVSQRVYFRLQHNFNDFISVDASYAPTLFLFKQAGFAYTDGSGYRANPLFENMVILNMDLHLTQNLLFSFPLILQHTYHRPYAAGAARNNTWFANFWIWPELDWDINPNTTLGLAFYSDNFVLADLSGTRADNAFRLGVFQAIMNVKL